MREDLRAHADGDALGAHDENDGNLGREDDGLLVAAVVGLDELRDLRVEQQVPGDGAQSAFDISRSRGLVARGYVAEVPLLVDEKLFVGQDDQGRADRGVAVGMVLHAGADDVRDLVELAVVHLEEGVHDAPLHGLEAVFEIRYGPVLDDVGRVVEEILVEDLLDVCHG